MNDSTDPGPVITGGVKVGPYHWDYVGRDERFEIYAGGREVTAADVALVVKKLGSIYGIKPAAVKLRLLPSTYEVVGTYTEVETREQYDLALQMALRLLGVGDGGREMCEYGMPSDYRAWLGFACGEAASFLRRFYRSKSKGHLRAVAEAIVDGTTSIAFSMRESHAALPYMTAVALKALQQRLQAADAG